MAKRRPKKQSSKPQQQRNKPINYDWMPWVAAGLALLVFSTGFDNIMVAMDDHSATVNNPVVKDLSHIFSGTFNLGMFAPLTWIVYSIAYALGGDSPFWYHFFSAAAHAVNVFLIWKIVRKLGALPWQAMFIALAFACHPLQVESVAWIAAFSTPLSSLFVLLSIQAYLNYTETEELSRSYWLALGFMLLACLAKSSAVAVPLVLLSLDTWLRRSVNRKTLLEKAPFFALSLVFGLLTVYSRGLGEQSILAFNPLDRILMVGHTIVFYWSKILWPFGLSIWYPFVKDASGGWHWTYYAAPVVLLGVLWLAYRLRSTAPVVWTGLLFFLANIALSLPLFTLGEFEFRSDRYNYLAIAGVLAILSGIPLWEPVAKRKWGGMASALLGGLVLLWLVLSVRRIADWGSTIELINKSIAAQGDNYGKAFLWRGMAYGDEGMGQESLLDFNNAIKKNPELTMAYKYRGVLLGLAKQYESSVSDLSKYLEKRPNDAESYFNRGLSLLNLERKEEALQDFNRSIELNPNFAPAYRSRGNLHIELGNTEQGQADLNEWERRRKR